MLKIIAKFIFAFTLVGWLIHKGTLNLALALELKNHFLLVGSTLLLMFIPFPLTALRWKLILEIKTQSSLPFFRILGLTWMGQFFSTILPGGVTGDIVKVVYARKLHSSLSKGYLLISAFIDRIFGLLGLLIIQGIMSAIFFQELAALSPKVEMLLYFNFLLFLAVILFILTLFLKQSWQQIILSKLKQFPKIGFMVAQAFEHFWLIGSDRIVFFKGLVLTLLTHLSLISSFFILIRPFLSAPLPFKYAFSFIPLGLISINVPISPMGLGVGHAMFQELFSYFNIHNGASLFNLFFLFEIFINLLGGIPYIFYREKDSTNTR